MNNIILNTDSYKIAHWKFFPPQTTHTSYYFEARTKGHKVPLTLLKYLLKRRLEGKVVTEEGIDEAKSLLGSHFNNVKVFNEFGFKYLLMRHKGVLPLIIKAAPENELVDSGNVLLTVENTDPNLFWLPGFIEPIICQLWYPCTIAALSSKTRKVIGDYLKENSDDTNPDYRLHDFGVRGATSMESSAIGGAAHLMAGFKGTDNLPALKLLKDYYGIPCAGNSIPASEHSVTCAWTRSKEAQAYGNMMWQFPTGALAIVVDSYDMNKAIEEHLGDSPLCEKIMNRDGVIVVRPDSGEPVPTILSVLDKLKERFGAKINTKGAQVLPSYLRVIWGDGIHHDSIDNILHQLNVRNWAAENLYFGMGSGLLQDVRRDDFSFAYKCSAIKIKNEPWKDVWKEPVGDSSKKSKRGRLKLTKANGGYFTHPEFVNDEEDYLVPSFLNGEVLI